MPRSDMRMRADTRLRARVATKLVVLGPWCVDCGGWLRRARQCVKQVQRDPLDQLDMGVRAVSWHILRLDQWVPAVPTAQADERLGKPIDRNDAYARATGSMR